MSQPNQPIHNVVLYKRRISHLEILENRYPCITLMAELQWHPLSVLWNHWQCYNGTVVYIYLSKSLIKYNNKAHFNVLSMTFRTLPSLFWGKISCYNRTLHNQILPSRCGVICNRKHNCNMYENCATCLSGISAEAQRVCSSCKAGYALGSGNCQAGQCYMFSCQ